MQKFLDLGQYKIKFSGFFLYWPRPKNEIPDFFWLNLMLQYLLVKNEACWKFSSAESEEIFFGEVTNFIITNEIKTDNKLFDVLLKNKYP